MPKRDRFMHVATAATMWLVVLLALVLPASLRWNLRLAFDKTNRVTGLTSVSWELSLVDGLLFLEHYDSTFGKATPGRYAARLEVLPARVGLELDTRGFDGKLIPGCTFAIVRGEWHNSLTTLIMPAALLFIPPLCILLALNRRRRNLTSCALHPRASYWRSVHLALMAICLGEIVFVAVVGLLLAEPSAHATPTAAARPTANRPADVKASAPAARPEAPDIVAEVHHQIDVFATSLFLMASDNGGQYPGPSLSDAIAAVRRGSPSLPPDGSTEKLCPLVFRDRDPWGHAFVYERAPDRRSVVIKSLGPRGNSPPDLQVGIPLPGE